MLRVNVWAALGLLALSGTVFADTEWMCGSVECASGPYNLSGDATGLHDLIVAGNAYDVTFFTSTEDSPFLFSDTIAALGAPITGVDAANALTLFANTVDPNFTNNNLWGPFPGDHGQNSFVTASTPLSDGNVSLDVVGMFLGGVAPISTTGQTVDVEDTSECRQYMCTKWTPISQAVSAPEISISSAPAALMLLMGFIAVMRGRRQKGVGAMAFPAP